MPPRRFLSARQVLAAESAYQAASGNDPDKEACVANIRAIDNASGQTSRTPFEINGVMGACCRHDIPLVLCDISTPGERHHYATALIATIIRAIPHLQHIGVAYDIGCRFDPSTRVRNLFGPAVQITWTVPVFHVYGHTYSCQLRYNPRNVLGFGLTDGEGMERVWSGLSNLITSTRGMARGERRFNLEERCLHLAVERRSNLFAWFRAKRKKMEQVVKEAKILFTTKYDPSCVAPQFQPDYQGLERPQAAGNWTPPAQFPQIPLDILTVVRRMAIERRRVVQIPTSSAAPSSDRVIPTITVVSLVSQSLLRIMAEIKLPRALVFDRPATTYRGTKTTVRLQTCLKNETANARKLIVRLNSALFSHFSAFAQVAPVLQWATLFEDEHVKLVEHWARANNPSLDALPWWANPSMAKAIDTFEELLRVVEEDERLELERSYALAWIEDRVHRLGELRNIHSVYRDEYVRASALKEYWHGSGQASEYLFPSGVPIDHAPALEDGMPEADIDFDLEAQLARLAV
ncbi:hypothetical protein CF319_g504 [Tilletia indica]|uniref:Uncharacterized protein n=1 Tax=Tilletia indica TaxID=43049 RepID=A0A177TIB9_9BASI|nr:hypothetical protein CF319_g504 [Tilletia indica]KAE8241835.1 hypothetical protein A4X13_0g7240 [Tilletia indica]